MTKPRTTTTRPALTLEWLPPGDLGIEPNPRSEAKLSKEFVDSVREGLLQPPVAHRDPEDPGATMVRLGKRRTLAAVEAGLTEIPVLVITAPAGPDVDRLVDQLRENDHREPLTTGEYAAGVAALFDSGLTAAQVAKRLHRPAEQVEAAKAAAGSPAALAAAATYGLDLIQTATLAAIEAVDAGLAAETVTDIEEDPEQANHLLAAARQEAEQRAALAAAVADLREHGVTVLTERPTGGWLSWLRDPDGNAVTEETHRSCPSHAAWVHTEWAAAEGEDGGYVLVPKVMYVCTDPAGNGHREPSGARPGALAGDGAAGSDAAKEAATQERRRVRANNEAWRAATTVRRDFLRALAGRKSPPEGGLLFLLESAVRHGGWVFKADTMGSDPLGWGLIGTDSRDGAAKLLAAASGPRAQAIVLALALGGYEDYISAEYRTWRSPDAGYESGGVKVAQRFLRQLERWGYTLAPIEVATADGNTAIDLSQPKPGKGGAA